MFPSHDQSGGQSVTLKVGASNASGVNAGKIVINNGGTGDAQLQFDYKSSTARAKIYVYRSEQELRFDTAGSERLRLGSSGNLALGGTNTSAYATQAHFFIGGVGDIYADTGVSSGKSLSITNNAYINTSGNWVYRATDKASNIYQYDGIIGFRYVASGTSGDTITWTEAARFDNSGRLLIGTTTYPSGS